MKTKIKIILKGLLYYITIFASIYFIAAIDYLYSINMFFPALTICASLCGISYLIISKDEFKKINGIKIED